jgi:hypothetical protein
MWFRVRPPAPLDDAFQAKETPAASSESPIPCNTNLFDQRLTIDNLPAYLPTQLAHHSRHDIHIHHLQIPDECVRSVRTR